MKNLSKQAILFLVVLVISLLPLAVFAVGRWDGSYDRVGALSPNNSAVGLQVRNTGAQSPYIAVECGTNNAYIGTGTMLSDGGMPAYDGGVGNLCGATTCRLIQFSLGEKFYSQLTGTENFVSAYSTSSFTCQVFKAKN